MDIEGNSYKTVPIGSQIWMAENLKTTKYNDGTPITLVTDNYTWKNLSTPAFCWYNNNENLYKATYGALYNWFGASKGKICPVGWHVPCDTEWTILETYLGGAKVAGGKLKETGTLHWHYTDTTATNETGFTALPNGYRFSLDGGYTSIGYSCLWWSSSERDETSAWYRTVDLYGMYRSSYDKKSGYSIRCVKD